jgi:hypothetical protein
LRAKQQPGIALGKAILALISKRKSHPKWPSQRWRMNCRTQWQHGALDRLAQGPCGYHVGAAPAAEPTALAAIALSGAGRDDAAECNLEWLATLQTQDGLAPPFAELQKPGWPTALTMLAVAAAAHNVCEPSAISTRFDLDRATQWLISAAGKPLERSPEYGHDGRLIGWPWVVGTHSWQEPTAWSVLALKAIGLADHPRTREGIKLLVDRLLDIGGCNYGNTVVLGQRLRPHIEPTGITLVALAGETIDDPRIERSCNYLESAITDETPPISLSYGLLGLTAQGRPPANLDKRLEAAYQNTVRRDPSPLALALLSLASQGTNCPLIEFTKT